MFNCIFWKFFRRPWGRLLPGGDVPSIIPEIKQFQVQQFLTVMPKWSIGRWIWEGEIMAVTSTATRKEECGSRAEKDLLATISTILRCKGSNLARMRAASVDVDLKRRQKARAKGRWAAFITRFLRKAEAQTEQLWRKKGNNGCFIKKGVPRDSPWQVVLVWSLDTNCRDHRRSFKFVFRIAFTFRQFLCGMASFINEVL